MDRETALKTLQSWLDEEDDGEQKRVFQELKDYLYAPYYCHQCRCSSCGNTFATQKCGEFGDDNGNCEYILRCRFCGSAYREASDP